MIAVLFDVTPADDRRSTYLQMAAALWPELEKMDGFLSVERFESLSKPGKLLSLSFWRDEAAIRQWRNTAEHRAAQHAGRNGVFAGYRLRIAGVLRDYGLAERDEAPDDSRQFHAAAEA